MTTEAPPVSKSQIKKFRGIFQGFKKVILNYEKNAIPVKNGWVDTSQLCGIVSKFDPSILTVAKYASFPEREDFEISEDNSYIRLKSGELNEVDYDPPECKGLFAPRAPALRPPANHISTENPDSSLQQAANILKSQIPSEECSSPDGMQNEGNCDLPDKLEETSLDQEEHQDTQSEQKRSERIQDTHLSSDKSQDSDSWRSNKNDQGARGKTRWDKTDYQMGSKSSRHDNPERAAYANDDRRRSGKRQRDEHREKDYVQLSRLLSNILRHKAMTLNLEVRPGGYVYLDELMKTHMFRNKGFSVVDIEYVVNSNDKKRFVMRQNPDNGRYEIKACQGHTMKIEHDLEKITNPADIPTVMHGTYEENWKKIKTEGLHTCGRQHIHFATGVLGDKDVISGMRWTCNVAITIDVPKAMQDGIEFFRSENNVILSPGDEKGFIKPKYFDNVCQIQPRRQLEFDRIA